MSERDLEALERMRVERVRWHAALSYASSVRVSPLQFAKAAEQCHAVVSGVCGDDESLQECLRLVWFGLLERSGRAVEYDSGQLDELAAATLQAYRRMGEAAK